MSLLSVLAAGLPAAAAGTDEVAPLLATSRQATVVPGRYLVALEPGVEAAGVAAAAGVLPDAAWSDAVDGFAARLTPTQLDRLRATPGVRYVEAEQLLGLTATRKRRTSDAGPRVRLAAAPVRPGDRQPLTVLGLRVGQPVVVTVNGRVVTRAEANQRGGVRAGVPFPTWLPTGRPALVKVRTAGRVVAVRRPLVLGSTASADLTRQRAGQRVQFTLRQFKPREAVAVLAPVTRDGTLAVTRIARLRTDARGRAAFAIRLPVDTPPGARRLRFAAGGRVRAGVPLRVTAPVTVRELSSAQWGLDRLDQTDLPLDGTFRATATGAGVTAYVVDSGIDTDHPHVTGRAASVFDAFGGDGEDCDGHGTHVAGTIGGSAHGVAPAVTIRGLRVLDCSGYGTLSGVVSGLEWIAEHGQRPAVVNLSLGGAYSQTLNDAVDALVAAGFFVSVAAGNEGVDTCNVSPASAPGAFAVAAADRTDSHATFSNHGPCVAAYAPGVAILSDWIGGGTATLSGTSMAAPHVAGVAALLLQTRPAATPAGVRDRLLTSATAAVQGVPAGTPTWLVGTGGL